MLLGKQEILRGLDGVLQPISQARNFAKANRRGWR
jgi:hypothetical protein